MMRDSTSSNSRRTTSVTRVDRKSTRLNSSHVSISYAVFCLKKKKQIFLMTKYNGRTLQPAANQIDDSVKRHQVDVIDLIQFHENIRIEDPDRYCAPGGAHES